MSLRLLLRTLASLHQKPNFSGLLASTFSLGIAFSFVAPFLSKWGTEEIGMTPSGFGVFMTITSLSAIVVSTVLAKLSDSRLPRKTVLILGSAAGVVGFAAYALIRDITLLLVVGCTMQAAASICFAQLFSHVRETYGEIGGDKGASSFTMSVVRVCFSFSWTLGPATGAVMLTSFGFRGLFLSAAALYLLFLLGVLKFVSYRKPNPQSSTATKPNFLAGLARPKLALSFTAFAAVSAANAINMMNLPLAMTRSLNGTESDLGIAFGIGPVVEIPLMLWFGHLAGKGYQLSLIKFGVIITAAYFFGLSFASQPWHVFILQILSGTAFAILTNIAILFFQDLLPGQMGLATSIFSNSGAVGNLVGMLTFGFILESFGHQGTFLTCALIATVASGLIVGIRRDASE
ncbi:sugar efflux transporter [Pelagicoccus albus]|uniref:Sugar efflux transporter n=1 Tax=Pelagicoccus albus TaxID=415222 RepID=A0A7X1E9H0_9BACT|nr:sugar efflux transporter [Pelagicoccus albus]MBC2607850.1 sugar efflux transporter [Pelagicoccus albus]